MTSHVVPQKIYFIIFGLLMVLTIVTVWASVLDLGRMNVVVALTIAFTKATLVILYFMHVRYSSNLIRLTAGAGLLWLAIMMVIMLSDYLTRDWLPVPRGW